MRPAVERMRLVKGDITKEKVDAIVNAANSGLRGGGGVDGAIHRAAGPELMEECRKIGGCPTGEARLTKGYRLPARYVIHAVGPIWHGGDRGEDELLASAYRYSLKLAVENGIRTISFPSISTGAYRFPLERATRIALRTVKEFLDQNPSIEQVRFVCFDDRTLQAYQAAWKEIFGVEPPPVVEAGSEVE